MPRLDINKGHVAEAKKDAGPGAKACDAIDARARGLLLRVGPRGTGGPGISSFSIGRAGWTPVPGIVAGPHDLRRALRTQGRKLLRVTPKERSLLLDHAEGRAGSMRVGKREEAMPDVRVSEGLWSTGMLPEGILERWLVEDGARVQVGEAVAAARIGEALHDIVSSAGGRLSMMAPAGDLIDPGCIIGQVHP